MANGGLDVRLTRVVIPGPLPPTPPPGVSLVGSTLVIMGSAGNDVVKVARQGDNVRVFASFLPAGDRFVRFRMNTVKDVNMTLGDGNDVALVASDIRLPMFIDGGAGDDVLIAGNGNTILLGGAGDDILFAGAGRNLLIGGEGRDLLAAVGARRREHPDRRQHRRTTPTTRPWVHFLAEWSSGRSLREPHRQPH